MGKRTYTLLKLVQSFNSNLLLLIEDGESRPFLLTQIPIALNG